MSKAKLVPITVVMCDRCRLIPAVCRLVNRHGSHAGVFCDVCGQLALANEEYLELAGGDA